MSVTFHLSSDKISFHLTQNEEINTNIPIYTTDNGGKVNVLQTPSSKVRVINETCLSDNSFKLKKLDKKINIYILPKR